MHGDGHAEPRVRIAAAGDLHCRETRRREIEAAFARIAGEVDAILLAGDLTTHGAPDQAAILADACAPLEVPVVTVLGNHDWHANRTVEVVETLTAGGITVLDRSATVLCLGGLEVGVAGTKGFVGGFAGSHIPDFGEPLLREVYAEATAEVEALDRGLREVAVCPLRVALLHYSPAPETLEGERHDIWSFLGTDRLAAPIREHCPHLVLHGHAHGGTFSGSVGEVPVYNVSVPVIGRDFCVFELSGAGAATAAVH
ncbi:MAG TPA: metallophosphoesterase [Solirubrobacteraceae bacterium]|nr:metallophosphoesterase [Solirubrobacteraceae bacterium]